jgi:DNA-binding transcriptional LysR family regulator
MDKLKAMAAFVRIVETGSLTAAAQRLDVSLTAVVRGLSALERALGVRLLNRTTRRIALTEEGREYFERCRRVLADVDEAESALTDRRHAPAGRLSVTAPVMFGRLHVAPVINGFLAEHERMRVELLLLDRVIDLLEEGVDLAIRIAPLPDSSLVAVPLGRTEWVLCASPAYLARHGTPAHPGELARHRAVRSTGRGTGSEWSFVRGTDKTQLTLADCFVCNQVEATLDACVAGLGLGRFLGYQVRALEAEGRLVRVLPEWQAPPVTVNLVHAQSRLLSPRIRAFMDWAVPRLRERLA